MTMRTHNADTIPGNIRRQVIAASRLLKPDPVEAEDCSWAIAAAIAEIELAEADRDREAHAQSKEGKKAARALVAAIRRLQVAAKEFEPFGIHGQSLQVSSLPLTELKRVREQLEKYDKPSPPPKPNADKKRRAVREARGLISYFSRGDWPASRVGELSGILIGDRTADFARYAKPVKGAKPGPR